jgi:uncharacterized protein (TIGR02466 family)
MAFDIPLYHKNIDCDIDEIKKTTMNLISKNKIVTKKEVPIIEKNLNILVGDICNGLKWSTDISIEEKLIIAALAKNIEDHALIYWKNLNYDCDFRPVIRQLWINVLSKGSSILSHSHSTGAFESFPIGGSFYPFDNASIYFENPLELIWLTQPFNAKKLTHPVFGQKLNETINTKSKDLLIFPGWLKHGVQPNQNDDDRITIGFSMSYEKNNS